MMINKNTLKNYFLKNIVIYSIVTIILFIFYFTIKYDKKIGTFIGIILFYIFFLIILFAGIFKSNKKKYIPKIDEKMAYQNLKEYEKEYRDSVFQMITITSGAIGFYISEKFIEITINNSVNISFVISIMLLVYIAITRECLDNINEAEKILGIEVGYKESAIVFVTQMILKVILFIIFIGNFMMLMLNI